MLWIRLLFIVLVVSTLLLSILGWKTGNPRYWRWLKGVWRACFVLLLSVLLFFFLSRLARL